MSTEFDLNVLPLHLSEGREQKTLPGIFAASPPRRPARGRKNDHLVIYLHIEGDLRLNREQQVRLLEGAAKTFYNIPGSMTAALRGTAEAVNEVILKRNLSGGQPVKAYLNLVARRADTLFIAQSGPTHGFLFAASDLEHFYDAEAAGRGLGVGRTPTIRYFQVTLKHGALYLIIPKIPSTWKQSTLEGIMGAALDKAGERLLHDASIDLQAVLIEGKLGNGQIHIWETNNALTKTVPNQAAPQSPKSDLPPITRPQTGTLSPTPPVDKPTEVASELRPNRSSLDESLTAYPATTEMEPTPDQLAAQREAANKNWSDQLSPVMTDAGVNIRDMLSRGWVATRRFLKRILPDEEALNIPSWVMGVIAVAVPLIVAAMAFVIYTNIGRERLYGSYLIQAKAAAVQANELGTGADARAAWERTLLLVDYTEQYQINEETALLRTQAQAVIDQLDAVRRLNFEPAIAGILAPTINVTRMMTFENDLYLLDGTSGNVLRAWLTGTGLEMDPNFSCGPGVYGSLIVEKLIDIVPLSKFNPDNARVLAIDPNGILLYCIPGESPLVINLEPPDNFWGEPIAMAYDDENLYVLDPLTNAVWVYEGLNDSFTGKPRFYFSAVVPSLGNAVDIAVNDSDLYILHADSAITHCIFNDLAEAPTTCDDPATLNDPRDGFTSGPYIQNAQFNQLARTIPPEPSVFTLDPENGSIYHFSLQLRLAQQYQDATGSLPDKPATSFAVTNTRTIFIAFGNQVFRSVIP